jgi:uncharacterized protein YcfJ
MSFKSTVFVLAAAFVVPAALPAAAHAQDDGYRNCRDVQVTRRKHHSDKNRVAGTAIGAIAGGVVGNQFGKGNGKTATTVAGAVAGGVIGNKVQKSHQRGDYETVIERRCD